MGKRWDLFEQDGGSCGIFEQLIGSSILLQIFSLLDLPTLFRLRCVCKSWYDAILSPQFIDMYTARRRGNEDEEPWAMIKVRTEKPCKDLDFSGIFDHLRDYSYFDYTNELQSHFELWRPRDGSQRITSLPPGPSPLFLGLSCSHAGLVCGRLMEHKESLVLVVGNPITGEWRTLPSAPLELRRPPFTSFIFVSDGCVGYKIVLFENNDSSESTVIFSSATGCWEERPGFDVHDEEGPPNTVSNHGILLDSIAFSTSQFPFVAALQGSTMQWFHVHVPPLPQDEEGEGATAYCLDIFIHAGECILVGFYQKWPDNEEPEWVGFGVWRLDVAAKAWQLVSKISVLELLSCTPYNDSEVRVCMSGGVIFFSAWYKNKTFGSWPPFAYDLNTSSWHCAKRGPDVDLECVYTFVPSLSATAY